MRGDDPLEVLRRWEDTGGTWRIERRTPIGLDIALLTCSGGEEMGRLTTSDPALLAYVGERWSSDGLAGGGAGG